MAETKRGVVLRLSTEGAEEVKRALRALGKDGEDALKKLERASKGVPPGLKLVDQTSREAQRSLDGLAHRGGVAGRTLASLGPAGLAAAAGIGAIALGIGAALRIAREANREFDEMAKRIRDLGIGSDLYQGLRFAGMQEGISGGQFDSALKSAQLRFGEIELGVGRAITQLQKADRQLLDNIRNASSYDQRLRLVADAIQKEEDATRRATLAKMFFGEANVEMTRILADGSAAFDGYIARARELGVVVSGDVLARQEELNNRMEVAAHIVDMSLKQAFVDLVPIIVWVSEKIAGVARAINEVIDAARDFKDMVLPSSLNAALEQSDRALDAINAKIAEARGISDWQNSNRGFWGLETREEQIARLEAERAELHRQRDQILNRLGELNNPPGGPASTDKPPPPALPDAEGDRIRRTIENLQHQADQLGRTAAEQAVYNALMQAGIDGNHAMAPAVMGAAAALHAKQEEMKALDKATEDANKRLQEMRELSSSLLKGFLNDLSQGKSLLEALGNAASNLGNRLIDAGINSLFSALIPGAATGSPMSIVPPGFFGGGRAAGGPVSAGKVYAVGEKGIEFFRPGVSGTIIPNHALGGGGKIDVSVNVYGTGDAELKAQVKAGAEIAVASALRDYDKGLPSRVAHIAANPREA